MADLFEEIEEQIRSEKYLGFLRRVAPWVTVILLLALLSYLGYWGFRAYQSRNLAAAASAYQKGADALADNDAAAATSFQAAAKDGAPGYQTLALMQQGNLKLADGKAEDAAKLYDKAAATAPNLVIGDLARLKAAEALLDSAPYAQLQTRLTPLTAAKRPYAIYAKEALAMAALMAGKTDDAKRGFTVIQLSLDAPDDMRRRAAMAVQLIDSGEAATAVAAAKAAPPPAPTAPAAPTPAPSAPKASSTPSPPAGAHP